MCRKGAEGKRTPWLVIGALTAAICGLLAWHFENADPLQYASHFAVPNVTIVIEHHSEKEVEVVVETTRASAAHSEQNEAGVDIEVIAASAQLDESQATSLRGVSSRPSDHVVLIVPRHVTRQRPPATRNPPQYAGPNPGGGIARRRPVPVVWRRPTHTGELAGVDRRRSPRARRGGGATGAPRAGTPRAGTPRVGARRGGGKSAARRLR